MRERALYAQRPLLNVWVARLGRHAHRQKTVGGGRRDLGAGKIREETVGSNQVCLSQSLVITSTAHLRKDVGGAVDFTSFGGIEEDAIAAMNHSLIVTEWTEGETEPGGKDSL